jgi:uncharacterized protein with beta-barrel porin domain
LSCPVFLDGTAIIGQDNCVWIRTSGWQSRQTGVAGYTADGMTMRFGGQREIAPNWFLGAAFGLGEDSKTMAGGSTGAGHTFDGSVALKYSEGPWLVAVSAAIGGGSYHTDRVVNLPWVYTLLPSDQTALLAGVRLRTAYELAFEDWYVRPYLDLDLTYVETGSFQETGPADLALDVRASRHTGVTIWPMLEVGLRLDFNSVILRPYAAGGFSYEPNPRREVTSSFIGALPWDGTFTSYIDSPTLQGSFEAGLQVYQPHGIELRAGYSLHSGYQNAFIRYAYHF